MTKRRPGSEVTMEGEEIGLEVALGGEKEEGIRIGVALGGREEEGIRIEVALGGATRTRRGAGS